MSYIAPKKNSTVTDKWNKIKISILKNTFNYIILYCIRYLLYLLNIHPKVIRLIRKSIQLSNPIQSSWPHETRPMVSYLLASGTWNYSFYQFNRKFLAPYWVQEQYNHESKSFIPRSHNVLSINQTHRNWISISYPGKNNEISIDPAMSIMPERDSYTLEFAIIEDNKLIRPHDEIHNIKFELKSSYEIHMYWRNRKIILIALYDGLKIQCIGSLPLIISIRPFNLESVHFLKKIRYDQDTKTIQGNVNIELKESPDSYHLSNYEQGDSLNKIKNKIKSNKSEGVEIKDFYGLCNMSFYYKQANHISLICNDVLQNKAIPQKLIEPIQYSSQKVALHSIAPQTILDYWFPNKTNIHLPKDYSNLYFYNQTHIISLWDYDAITPGSFTYHHFWIRDAVVMLYTLLQIGAIEAVKVIIQEKFKQYITRKGFFKSQDGEWDANGQALWIIGLYLEFSKQKEIEPEIKSQIKKMVNWIYVSCNKNGGVLPPGFSAEHLGVADWYLWDNFWALAGLKKVSHIVPAADNIYKNLSQKLHEYLEGYKYLPAALGRKQDAGMIGSISCIYPLNLSEYYNIRTLKTLFIIKKKYFAKGGFFQHNIHSGINIYLTLQVAESFLHFGLTSKAYNIFKKVYNLKAHGYTFPEAIHPITKGGCMGDGFHGWAFSEVITFIHNMFFLTVYNKIILLAGIPKKWYTKDIFINNLRTPYGTISISLKNSILVIKGLNDLKGKQLYMASPTSMKIKKTPWHHNKALDTLVDKSLMQIMYDNHNLHDIKVDLNNLAFT